MSAQLIRRVLELLIVIFFAGGTIMIARAFAAMFDGDFGTVNWPVQAGAYDLQVELGEGALATFVDANLAVSGQPFWHAVDLLFSFAGIAIFIIALVMLRNVLMRFAEGDLLNIANADAMRKIGGVLLLACALSVIQAIVVQSAILSAVTPADPAILHPSISWDVSGATNVWLHYDPPLVTLLLGGLAILFAEAIRSGCAYRQDSESVV